MKILSSRRRYYVVRISILLIMIALIAGMAGCLFPPATRNLQIRTWYDLNAIRDNLSGHHILMNDLDSTTAGYQELAGPTANEGKGWLPIGGPGSEGSGPPFTGIFEGQGYEIRDLFISLTGIGYVGLFSILGEGGRIEDIGVMNAHVNCTAYAGSLVGINLGTVSNSYSTGSGTGKESAGGLLGTNNGTVVNSYSLGNVTGNSHVGGLVGYNEGTVTNSFWNTETSGQATSAGGTGKTTAQMQNIATFSAWNIVAVTNSSMRNPAYIWNIVNNTTYPFLNWQP